MTHDTPHLIVVDDSDHTGPTPRPFSVKILAVMQWIDEKREARSLLEQISLGQQAEALGPVESHISGL